MQTESDSTELQVNIQNELVQYFRSVYDRHGVAINYIFVEWLTQYAVGHSPENAIASVKIETTAVIIK